MDKPARRAIVAMQARPEQPEAPPFLVLDPVIIAERLSGAEAFRLPPFIGDPLRTVGARHPMPAAAPSKAERRIIGQQPKCFDRLRRLEQSDRPLRFAPTPALLRGHGGGRVGAADRN